MLLIAPTTSPFLSRLRTAAPFLIALVLILAAGRLARGHQADAPGTPPAAVMSSDAQPGQPTDRAVGLAALLAASVPVITAVFAGIERVTPGLVRLARAVRGLPDPTPAVEPEVIPRTRAATPEEVAQARAAYYTGRLVRAPAPFRPDPPEALPPR